MIHRVGISVKDKKYYFLRFEEMSDGTVNLYSRHASFFTHGARGCVLNGDLTHEHQRTRILNEYHSFHPIGADGMALFNHHLILESVEDKNGIRRTSRHKTKAFENGKHVVAFGQQCQDLSNDRYALLEKHLQDDYISIGSYSPEECTLVYFVIVSATGNHISPDLVGYHDNYLGIDKNAIAHVKINFNNFNFTIYYTFITKPSNENLERSHFISGIPEDMGTENEMFIITEGFQDIELSSIIGSTIDKFRIVHWAKGLLNPAKQITPHIEKLTDDELKNMFQDFMSSCYVTQWRGAS